MGATGTSTSVSANQAEVKADDKVQTLLTEVLRCCDSILEALGSTRGGGGDILGVRGGINIVSMGVDAVQDNIGASVDDGFEWPVDGVLDTCSLGIGASGSFGLAVGSILSTRTPGNGRRSNLLATDDNFGRGGLAYDASALGGGGPRGRNSCGLGQEGPKSNIHGRPEKQ
ncbi:hypothetical protein GUJ93_ZPchr0003g17313 [Zizania palustris]|uniref:Uncharacterized protein n=1 Tax=Zizania palustris TaxID=103762 RepID=A0A8J5S0K8_ZIZPA|nr:hypothetical protein GUJ93_ZPchr0003g17313 [Zizania palustris]